MKIGAERKKVALLGGLLLVAAGIFCFDYFSGSLDAAPRPKPALRRYPVAPVKSAASHLPIGPGAVV